MRTITIEEHFLSRGFREILQSHASSLAGVSNPVMTAERQIKLADLTEWGRALKQITPSLEQDVNAHALDGFSEDEQRFFNRLLSRALHNMIGK